jgi:hypothetical protein
MRTLALLVAILASVTLVAEAGAQTQVPPPRIGEQTPAQGAEKTVEGQVGSVDSSRTAITLTDGTKLVTPPGATIRPGALVEGMIVIASYREENGEKVLTEITVKDKKPSGTPRQN